MKKTLTLSALTLFLLLATTIAGAEDLTGKFGITGRVGFLVPADSEVYQDRFFLQNVSTDTGVVGGGGFLYGINRNWAAEFDITATGYSGDVVGGSADFSIVNIALGGQYRFKEISKFTPYLGAGLDILINSADQGGASASVDTVPGVHVTGGVDYFFTKKLAFTSELKIVVAPNADITYGGLKVGNFDPSSFSMTFGVRYIIN